MHNSLDNLPHHEPHLHIAHFNVTEDVATHTHDYIELAYVTEGSFYHHAGRHCEKVVPGDYFIIDQSQPTPIPSVDSRPLSSTASFSLFFRPISAPLPHL